MKAESARSQADRTRPARRSGDGPRGALVLGALAASAILGCTTMHSVPREEMVEGKSYARSLVYLDDGARYEFQRVSFLPDTLVGEYTVTVEHEGEQPGIVTYEDEERVFRLPLTRVDSVTVVRRDPVKSAFYGAGIAAVGYMIYELIDSDNLNESSNDGTGKPGAGGLKR